VAAVTIRGFKRALTEEDRQQIARTIADRLKRNWTLARKPGPELGPSLVSGMKPAGE
jgi:hypothetical protein